MQASRPRSLLPPLQIGLGVQLHHHFASKFPIDTCHSLGFCSLYAEVQRYSACAAASQGTSVQGVFPDSCIQFVADNVDHNVRTLDGYNTFHGMGIIAGVTSGVYTARPISRTYVTSNDLIQIGKIEIHHYRQPTNGMSNMSFAALKETQKIDSTLKLDEFTKITWPLKSPMPGWTGLMQMVQSGLHPGRSSFTFLPMIDLKPSDLSCVFSTLKFITEQARIYNKTPIIFDQPLYWKALVIISNEEPGSDLKSIILRLGGFHLKMSFLGAVGHLMNGLGLHQLKKQIKIWDIKKTKAALGDQCNLLPVFHALSGCDTTSRLFGIGKGPAFKKLQSSEVLQDHARVYLDSTSDVEKIATAGEDIMTAWYGGQPFETLDRLRFRKFAIKTHSGLTSVKVHTLPPTSNAARFHCMRSFLQCQCWIGNGDSFVPQNWGWVVTEGKLHEYTWK